MYEWRKIEHWRQTGVSIEVSAEKLVRHQSTIIRELQRDTFRDKELPKLAGYYCVTAHKPAADRRTRLRKLDWVC